MTDQLDAAAAAPIAWQELLAALEQSVRSDFANAVSTLLTGHVQRNQPISRNAIWFQLQVYDEDVDPTLLGRAQEVADYFNSPVSRNSLSMVQRYKRLSLYTVPLSL
jgi:hypothetical protein